METTYDGTTEQARAPDVASRTIERSVNHIKATASSEIKNLIADVEELMARIVDLKDADVVRVRGKVQRAVDATKQAWRRGPRPYGSTRKTSPARLTTMFAIAVASGWHCRSGRRRRGDFSDRRLKVSRR